MFPGCSTLRTMWRPTVCSVRSGSASSSSWKPSSTTCCLSDARPSRVHAPSHASPRWGCCMLWVAWTAPKVGHNNSRKRSSNSVSRLAGCVLASTVQQWGVMTRSEGPSYKTLCCEIRKTRRQCGTVDMTCWQQYGTVDMTCWQESSR